MPIIHPEKNVKKEVKIKIKGVHKDINSDTKDMPLNLENTNCKELIENVVETECKGFYQKIGEQIYIKYIEEIKADIVSNNLLKIDNNIDNIKVEIIKKGAVNSKMIFIEKMKTESIYSMPYGKINMMIDTNNINIKIKENIIFVTIEYDLFMNKEHISQSNVDIIIELL